MAASTLRSLLLLSVLLPALCNRAFVVPVHKTQGTLPRNHKQAAKRLRAADLGAANFTARLVGSLQLASYAMALEVGNPPVSMLATVDTGSSLTHLACAGCSGCPASKAKLYQPADSSTAQVVSCTSAACSTLCGSSSQRSCLSCEAPPLLKGRKVGASAGGGSGSCNWGMRYGDNTRATGYVVTDALQLGSRIGPVVMSTFGCQSSINVDLTPGQGLLALGSEPASTLMQMVAKGLIDPAFSFCLGGGNSPEESGSRFVFGRYPAQLQGAASQTTSLTSVPGAADLYNIGVTSLRVGGKTVQVNAGFTIDTGTTAVGFPPVVMARLRALLKAGLPKWIQYLPADSFTNSLPCFGALRPASLKQFVAAFPPISVAIGGGGSTDWLPKNYLVLLDASNNPGPAYCALMFATDLKTDVPPGILGASFLQDRVTAIDLESKKVKFTSVATCRAVKFHF